MSRRGSKHPRRFCGFEQNRRLIIESRTSYFSLRLWGKALYLNAYVVGL